MLAKQTVQNNLWETNSPNLSVHNSISHTTHTISHIMIVSYQPIPARTVPLRVQYSMFIISCSNRNITPQLTSSSLYSLPFQYVQYAQYVHQNKNGELIIGLLYCLLVELNSRILTLTPPPLTHEP